MNWSDSSEIVLGLILDHRLSVNAVRPELFIEPYNKVIKLLQKEPTTSIEDLIIATGLSPIQGAFDQVHRMNGLGERDWIKILEQSALFYDAGAKGAKLCQKMMRGESVDLSQWKGMINNIEQESTSDYIRLSDIKEEEMPFIPTGWEVWDTHLGGIPEVGMVIIGGRPGIGKTTNVARVAGSFVKYHKTKKVALHSLEMMASEYGPRQKSLIRLTKDEQDRLLVCDKPLSVVEIINRAATVDDLGLIIIDFIDLAIDGVIDVTSTSLAYTQIAKACKLLHCPIIVIAQLTDFTGMPKPRNIRFSRLAWGLAWMVIMLYDPSVNWSNDSEEEKNLPIVEGSSYMIAWKIRGGFRKHQNECPGAIMIPFEGKRGWHPTQSKWFSLKNVS